MSQAIFVLFGSFALAVAAIFASQRLHDNMLKNIMRSPMSFYDTTPLGRILNRFSKDIYTIDEVIPRSMWSFIFTLLSVISTIIVIVIATPVFAIVIIPLAIFYAIVQVSILLHPKRYLTLSLTRAKCLLHLFTHLSLSFSDSTWPPPVS